MKRAANLSIETDLLEQAKSLKINLSGLFEQTLRREIRKKQAEQWKKDNKKALASYDHHIEEHGTFSEQLRKF